jgi:mannose/fructose/N-acetylgalactosamine-specific phosphotransferase system component IIB
VDDRLIHGQVVVGWARHTQADCIIVANDAVAADPMQRTLLPMAVPQGIEVAIYRVREAAEKLSGGAHAARRAILLFASPADALAFTKAGGALAELNVGGIRFAPGKEVLRKSVSLGAEDLQSLKELSREGVEVYLQMVPTDQRETMLAHLA